MALSLGLYLNRWQRWAAVGLRDIKTDLYDVE
jgi:hypothetical protein